MSVAASIILFIGVFYYFKFYILKKDNVDKQLTMESPQTGLIQSAVIDTNSKQLLAVGGIRNEPIQAQAKAKRLQKVVHEQNPTETSLQVVENDDEVVSAYDPVLSERRVYQGTTQAEEVKAEEEIFVVVESMPVFPGGESALMIYLSQHLQYPDTIAKELLQTTAYVKFIVDTSGKAKNPVILRSISPNFDKQMLKIIEEMPLWQPATTRGKKVAVQMILPLKLEHTK
jgi:hypothetical protein